MNSETSSESDNTYLGEGPPRPLFYVNFMCPIIKSKIKFIGRRG